VGGNLLAQAHFDHLFASANISEVAGREYSLVVCAGAPAEKWKANRNPVADAAAIERLVRPLQEVRADKFVLISTVDVYPSPVGVDETSRIDPDAGSVYGRHRYVLECFVRERFDSLVVRLPALFGRGLKKNAVYDLLHGNRVDAIHADAVFQFYGLHRLWRDVEQLLGAGISLVNLVTEPVSMYEVAREAFGLRFQNRPPGRPPRYDVRSIHGARLGGASGYFLDKRRVLSELADFVATERRRAE
jgi:dTDP-4-dehydrorhamnose reductase